MTKEVSMEAKVSRPPWWWACEGRPLIFFRRSAAARPMRLGERESRAETAVTGAYVLGKERGQRESREEGGEKQSCARPRDSVRCILVERRRRSR